MFEPSEFFIFLHKPVYQFDEKRIENPLIVAIKLYLVFILFIGLFNLLNIITIKQFITLPSDHTFTLSIYHKEHLWIYFFLIGIFSPIMEEIIFRLPLVFNPTNISLSISTLIALIVRKMSSSISYSILLFVLLFILTYFLSVKYKTYLLSFWNKNFKYIFYAFSLSFGLAHISNYEFIAASQYFIAPILIFPQLVMGFISSFTRMLYKNGFLICILFHCLLNSITVSVFLIQYINNS